MRFFGFGLGVWLWLVGFLEGGVGWGCVFGVVGVVRWWVRLLLLECLCEWGLVLGR